MGAIKAGVAVVTITDKENIDALDYALSSSKAKGLIFSPDTPMADKVTRGGAINKLMPELSKMYLGDELKVSRYPNLTQIIQTGFKGIRGVNLFKDLTVYASP